MTEVTTAPHLRLCRKSVCVCACVSCLQGVRLICKLSNRDARTEIKRGSRGLVLLSGGNRILFDVPNVWEGATVGGREGRMGEGEKSRGCTEREVTTGGNRKDRLSSK